MEFPSTPDTDVTKVEYLISTTGNDLEYFTTLVHQVAGNENDLLAESVSLSLFEDYVAAVATEIDSNAPVGMSTTVGRQFLGTGSISGPFTF